MAVRGLDMCYARVLSRIIVWLWHNRDLILITEVIYDQTIFHTFGDSIYIYSICKMPHDCVYRNSNENSFHKFDSQNFCACVREIVLLS